MKKIMFDDKYDLTKAVLEGRKTMTRRVIPVDETKGGLVPVSFWDGKWCGSHGRPLKRQPYKVGEVVAVAQPYKDCVNEILVNWGHKTDITVMVFQKMVGWANKMFVRADLMPHQIRITGVLVERLQDISDEDCIREGIEEDSPYYWVPVNMSLPNWRKIVEGVSDMYSNDRDGKVYPHFWDSPRKAFAALIDKIFGKGTFESNPWVFVYEFELVK